MIVAIIHFDFSLYSLQCKIQCHQLFAHFSKHKWIVGEEFVCLFEPKSTVAASTSYQGNAISVHWLQMIIHMIIFKCLKETRERGFYTKTLAEII